MAQDLKATLAFDMLFRSMLRRLAPA